jgi:ABC-type amino acid transport substrate-binding protein
MDLLTALAERRKKELALRKRFLSLVTAFFLLFSPGAALAQGDSKVTVGVYVSPPFVMLAENEAFQGMAFALWEAVSKPLGIASRYVEYHSLKELLDATARHEADIILTNLTVTHERAALLAISFPWFDAGQRVLIHREHKPTVFEELRDSGRLGTYLLLAALLVALTIGITLIRRRIDPNFTKEWKLGLAASFHDLILSTRGKLSIHHCGWAGSLLSGIWMLAGVTLIAYVTSTLTAAMTTASLRPDVDSLYDLKGQSIGVMDGSVGQALLRSMGMTLESYGAVEDAVDALYGNKIAAVVYDAPVLEYIAKSRPELNLTVVGNLFHPEKYAFAANEIHRDLMHAVSLGIITMHENGDLAALKEKYFGHSDL